MLTSVWNAKEKNLFRAGMNRWFRRKYFVEKSPNAVINKRDWITVTRKYLFYLHIYLLTHIYLFALSSVLRADCLAFFHSRTEFLLQ